MTDSPAARPLPFLLPVAAAAARVLLVAVAAFAIGGVTSYGQAALPDTVSSLANSVAGWTLPTAGLVFVTARSTREAMLSGAVAFVALTVGYAVVSTLRGFSFDPMTWAVIGLVAGPVVGAATHALRLGPVRAAVGSGVLAGILIGEGIYGLTVIAATTSPVFWWVVIGCGAALLVAVALRLRAIRPLLVMLAVAAVTAGAFVAAYTALPAVTGLI